MNPSKGDWGEPEICDYTIEERRYSNTGEKYIGIFWEHIMHYAFLPSDMSIRYNAGYGYNNEAPLTEGDAYPWN